MKHRIVPILTVMLMVAVAAFAQLPEHKVDRGTLLSISDEKAVVRVEGDEQLAVRITANTMLPSTELKQGDAVIVDYNLGPDSDQMAEARAIRMDEEGSGLGSQTESARPASTADKTDTSAETTHSQSAAKHDSDAQDPATRSAEGESSSTESRASRSSDLPQTAGSLPLVALLGLIAVGAGALVRLIR